MAQRTKTRTDRDGSRERDFRTDLTNQIIALVEQGAAPWQKPWSPDQAAGALELPHNAVSGRSYHGGNAMWLMARSGLQGYDDPRWCTFKQATDKGWKIKKGSKATTVEYWQFDKEERGINPDTGQAQARSVKLESPRVFYAQVFNAKQIEGIPPYEPRTKEKWNPVEAAERALSNCGAKIVHDQRDRAFYRPASDSIHLPPRAAFQSPTDFYETALHETCHSTGLPSRMNRDLSGQFGSASYAKEELRAQMASLFLSAELGIPFNPERHAAYQASWVKVLQNDKHEIFRAARDAEDIADYVVELARGREKDLDQGGFPIEQIAERYPSHTQSFGQELAAMEMQPNTDPKENRTESPENGHILYGGQKVDTIRYDLLFDAEKIMPTIETGNLALYQGRKQVAVIQGLSREEVAKTVGPYNMIALENQVGAHKRGNDPTHVKGNLARQALSYFDSDTLSPSPQPSKDKFQVVQPPEGAASAPDHADTTPETGDRNAADVRNNVLYSELVALKNEHMGKNARLFRARDNTGRSQYDGPVIAETGSCIIQKLSDDTAIVHEKTNLQRDVEVGDDVSIVYDNGKVYVEDLAADHDKLHDRRQHEVGPQEPRDTNADPGRDSERANRASFFSARNTVLEQLGKNTKVYDAAKVDSEKGKFTGTVIAITDHHVMQRIGANTVISHEKADLAGLLTQGAFVQIQYQNGIGSISPMDKQFSREHDRALSR
jgi:antirestriction protein ArdC